MCEYCQIPTPERTVLGHLCREHSEACLDTGVIPFVFCRGMDIPPHLLGHLPITHEAVCEWARCQRRASYALVLAVPPESPW